MLPRAGDIGVKRGLCSQNASYKERSPAAALALVVAAAFYLLGFTSL